MARVAIYGSCVTRDAFEVRAHPHEIVGYFARSSMISQCAEPVAYTDADLGDEIKTWGRRIFTADLEKSIVDRIVAARPDIVVIDLVDERLSLLRAGDALLTLSSYGLQTPLMQGMLSEGTRIPSTAPARNGDFLRAAPVFMSRLLEHIEPERILLHRAMYSMRVRGRGRFDPKVRDASKGMNALLESWYDAVAAASGCRQFRPRWRDRVSDPGHKWGLSPYHYTRPYYERFLSELDTMRP